MKNDNFKFALFGNTFQKEKSDGVVKILQILRSEQASIAIEEKFYEFIKPYLPDYFLPDCIFSPESVDAHFAISIGGDGTFLKTAAYVGKKNIPIIGINTGRLGFLADISLNETEAFIKDLQSGTYNIEKRSTLQVFSNDDQLELYPYALNEIAVLKHDNSSMITIETVVNGNLLNVYQADGLIISTPTGSTGYSLSVGGPIIAPGSHTFVISPVAPHSLNTRTIVLNDDCTINLHVTSRSKNYLLAIDGRSQSLPQETQLSIRRAPYYVYIVRQTSKHYFDTLRSKLMWGLDLRV